MTNITDCASMSQGKRNKKKVTIIALFLMGLIMILIGYPDHSKIKKTQSRCTESAAAVVISTEQKETRTTQNKTRTLYRATLELPSEPGAANNRVVTEWSRNSFTENSEISIKYDPNDPECIYVPGNPPYDGGEIKLLIGAITIGIGFLYLIGYLVSAHRE